MYLGRKEETESSVALKENGFLQQVVKRYFIIIIIYLAASGLK